jgi:phosphoribosylformylglycinamidine cyclo-ligase
MSYEKRGVSAGKEEVHQAIQKLDKGLVPNAFCKILPDLAAGDPAFANVMHADTAGTKTSLAYLYWKETGNLEVWKGIVQDAIVMNLDDMACAGFTSDIILSSTIGRNKNLVPGEVLKALIGGTIEFIENMQEHGVHITLAGGETADVGDIVRTADVGFTAFARAPRRDIVDIDIKPGDVVVGFASYGQATYEAFPNSGIGSNGLSFARHEVLKKDYATQYPESFDPGLDPAFVYTGKYRLTDKFEGHDIGRMLLSPTRTFVPLIKKMLENHRQSIHGIIHNTGGGQTKVLHFINNLHIIKDNLLPVPTVFRMIREITPTPWQEMFKVFNMGQRLEVYCSESAAGELISQGNELGIRGQVIGHAEAMEGRKVTLHLSGGEKLEYT